jgi:hypothetical protein
VRYERDLQVKLRERYRRLFKTDSQTAFIREMSYFRTFLLGSPVLKAIIENIATSQPELDPDQWVKEHPSRGNYDWPTSESGRAKVVWHLMSRIADGEDPFQIAFQFSMEKKFSAMLRDFTEHAVEPFVEYLEERIGSESELLYILERFTRRLELFDQDELYRAYERDTKRGEAGYDHYFRRFLFDQGIDYPFSQPQSASGRADVVSGIESDDPLVSEVKLYDGDQYGVPYMAKGFQQALSYAHDYSKTVAHLIVINLSEHGLQFPSDEPPGIWPPRLHVEGVTVYIVTARAKPLPSASNRGTSSPKIVTREQLVRPREEQT